MVQAVCCGTAKLKSMTRINFVRRTINEIVHCDAIPIMCCDKETIYTNCIKVQF